jgi:hypothetical protein
MQMAYKCKVYINNKVISIQQQELHSSFLKCTALGKDRTFRKMGSFEDLRPFNKDA